jgi:tetratricopeptide (TPR) repeat protein
LVLEQKGDWAAAARLLEDVVDGAETPPALAARALTALGRCWDELGAPDLRLSALERAVEADPASSAARQALAEARGDGGRWAEAAEHYRTLEKRDPQEGDELGLARALLRRAEQLPSPERDWAEVERTLERAEAGDGRRLAVARLRAEMLSWRGRSEEARAVLDQLRRERPDDPEAWAAEAEWTARAGDPAAAWALLEEGKARLGDRIELRLAGSDLWPAGRASRAATAALSSLRRGVGRFSAADQARLLRRLTLAYQRLGMGAEALREARRLAEARPDNLRDRLLLLDAALQSGTDAEVGEVLDGMTRLEGEDGAGWRFGRAALLARRAARGDRSGLTEARDLLAEIAERRPNWSRAALLEGWLQEQDGRIDEAATAYLRAVDLGERDLALLARVPPLLAGRGRYVEAERAVRAWRQEVRLTPEQARLAADVALRARQPARAVDLAREAVTTDGRDALEQAWLGGVLAAAGRPTEAEDVLRRALQLDPTAPEPWLALVSCLVKNGRREQAEQALEEARGKMAPERATLALAEGYELLARFDLAARQYRTAARHRSDDSAALQRAVVFFVRVGRPDDAEPLLRQLLALTPPLAGDSAAWARRRLALALAERGDADGLREADALLDRNRGRDGESAADRRARAFVAAAPPGGRAQALRDLERLPVPSPEIDEPLRLARLYDAEGDWAAARRQLDALLTRDADNPAALALLADGLLRRGKAAEARPWLLRLERVEPDSARTRALRERAGPRR